MKTVLFVLPDHFSIRNFLYSPFIEQDFSDMKIVFVLPYPDTHTAVVPEKFQEHIILEDIEPDVSARRSFRTRFLVWLNDTLNYRFTKIEGLNHIDIKEAIPHKYVTSDNDRFKLRIRFPFPRSRMIYRALHWLYNSSFFRDTNAKQLVQKYSPNLIITTNPQIPATRGYYIEAKKRGIKTMSYVNSWDFLPTDGPVMTTIDEFIVWNERMIRDLCGPQHVDKPTHNIGPIHMDYSFSDKFVWSRDELCKHLDVSKNAKLVTYGVCGERIGKHEPEVAAYLADQVLKEDEHLIIRGHPEDQTIPERFKHVVMRPNAVICQGIDFNEHHEGDNDDRIVLYSLMKHSSVVLCGPTTLALDALRFDTPVINVAFDGSLQVPEGASIRQRFKLDHYAPLHTFDGIDVAGSFQELEEAVHRSLTKPETKAPGRKAIRANYLEPLDGKATERMYDIITNA